MRTSVGVRSNSTKRSRGVFYTPSRAAEFMAGWVMENHPQTVLEPSFGEGIFLRALYKAARAKGCAPPRTIGVEIDREVFQSAVADGIIQSEDGILCDFLRIPHFAVDAVIGNPPFVRLRHMPNEESSSALASASLRLGTAMDPSGSVWMPFVLHATSFIRHGGRLAFVLPLDATYVRYARPLWQYLAMQFGELRVIRVRERLFPEILQDVVILMAAQKGESCSTVQYTAYPTEADFLSNKPSLSRTLDVGDIALGKRSFTWAHVAPDLIELLQKLAPHIASTRELARFNIGYVAGDKSFFHPTADTCAEFGIENSSLTPTVSSSRNLRNSGLYTSGIPSKKVDRLFLPKPCDSVISNTDKAYVTYGEALGVHQRYKCRAREPWYVVPYVKAADVILTVFTERPVLAVNDARLAASNSLLCGYVANLTPAGFAARWYTSLTLLHIEAEIHSLGGGVMVMVPQETGNIKIIHKPCIDESGLTDVDRCLTNGDVESAYRVGDDVLLKRTLGLTETEIEAIYEGIDALTYWRTSAVTSRAL